MKSSGMPMNLRVRSSCKWSAERKAWVKSRYAIRMSRDRRSVLVERWMAMQQILGSTPDVSIDFETMCWVAINTEG